MLYQVVVFSMLLTPLADLLGRRLAGAMPRPAEASHAASAADHEAAHGHVIICGFGRVGRQIARLLDAAGQRWIATDLDSEAIEQARRAGQQVFYGDCSRAEILRALDVDHAALVLITLNDAGATERALIAIRQLVPRAARDRARPRPRAGAHVARARRAARGARDHRVQPAIRPRGTERAGRGRRVPAGTRGRAARRRIHPAADDPPAQ